MNQDFAVFGNCLILIKSFSSGKLGVEMSLTDYELEFSQSVTM